MQPPGGRHERGLLSGLLLTRWTAIAAAAAAVLVAVATALSGPAPPVACPGPGMSTSQALSFIGQTSFRVMFPEPPAGFALDGSSAAPDTNDISLTYIGPRTESARSDPLCLSSRTLGVEEGLPVAFPGFAMSSWRAIRIGGRIWVEGTQHGLFGATSAATGRPVTVPFLERGVLTALFGRVRVVIDGDGRRSESLALAAGFR